MGVAAPPELKRHSPTSTLDIEENMSSDTVGNAVPEEHAPVEDSSNTLKRRPKQRMSSPTRPSKSGATKLPTLDESGHSTSDEEDDTVRSIDLNSFTTFDGSPDDLEAEDDEPAPSIVSSSPRHPLEIEKLKNQATKLASRGKEENAIQAYYKALRLMRVDLNSITKRLSTDPDRWRDDWLVTASAMADVRTAVAILYERLGAYVKAIAACKEAREIYEKSPLIPEEGKETIPHLESGLRSMDHMMERLHVAKSSFDARKALHEESLQLQLQINKTRIASVKEGLYEKRTEILNTVLEMEKESLGETHPQVAETLQSISALYKEQKDFAKAIKFMNKALSILKLCLGPYHPRCAIAFRELAQLYEARKSNHGDIDMAIGLYAQCTTSFRECYGTKSPMVGASLNNEAVLHIQQSDFDLAVEKLSDALVAYESSTMNKDKTINTDSAQVWKNLGECYVRRGEFESAHFAYNNALEIQKDARIQASKLEAVVTKGCDDASLADTLLRLGNATKSTHRYEDAHGIYKEALLIYRMHYTSAHRAANGKICDALADAQDRLAHTLYCIAEVQEIRGVYEEAEALYSEALQLRLHSDAQREQARMNTVHCAMALAGIASCHLKTGLFDDAIGVYKESRSYLVKHGVPGDHKLMQKVDARIEMAENKVVPSQSFADLSEHDDDQSVEDITLQMDQESKRLMDAGKYDAAVDVLTKALVIRRQRLTNRQKDEVETESLIEKDDVAMTLVNYATILYQKGEVRQAEMLTREAIRLYQSNGYEDDHPIVRGLQEQLTKLSTLEAL